MYVTTVSNLQNVCLSLNISSFTSAMLVKGIQRNSNNCLLISSLISNYIVEGLHWVLHYYHKGCKSWNWYFPHLYSPLSSDLVNIHEFYADSDISDDDGFKTFRFEETEPFPSLAQLLSVLPPQSANLLPQSLSELMIHPSSPIAEFYPTEFKTDQNGKRQSWEAIVKIPFIDGDKLLGVVNSVIENNKNGDMLTTGEKLRNKKGQSHLFVPEREAGKDEALYPPLKESELIRPAANRRRSGSRGGGRGGGRRSGRGGGRGARGRTNRRAGRISQH